MKSPFFIICVAASALLAATSDGWAIPPRQHPVTGIIENIDCARRSFTFRSAGAAQAAIFIWNDGTRFTKSRGCPKCGLDTGQTVRVSYRREVGQNVLGEVNVKRASNRSVAGCK